jgi:hypothetical protein
MARDAKRRPGIAALASSAPGSLVGYTYVRRPARSSAEVFELQRSTPLRIVETSDAEGLEP